MQRELHGIPSGFAQHSGKIYDVRQAIANRRAELIKEINQEAERQIILRSRSADNDLDDDDDIIQGKVDKDVTTSDDKVTKEPNKTEEQQDKKPNDQSTNVVEQDSQKTSQVGNVIKKVRKTPTLDELGSNVSVALENMYNGFKAGRVSEDAIISFIDRIADPKRHRNDNSIIGTANEIVNKALGINDDINNLRNDGALDALRSFIETVDDDVKTSIKSGGINGAIHAASLNRLANKAKVATSSVAGNVDLSNVIASASRSEAAAAIDDIHSRAKFAEDEINSVCEQYGIRDYQSLIDTYNNLDKPMRDRNGNVLPSINEAISNIHRAKDEFDGITSGEIKLPANVDKEAYLKELKRVGAANLEYISNASKQFGSYQNVMSFKSAFDKIQATRAEDEHAMDVYNKVYGNIFRIDADKIKRSQKGADTGITFQTPGEIPTSTAQYMNRAASNPTFGLKNGAIINNNVANLYAHRVDATNPLIKYYNTQITRSGIAREKERVMQQKAENNNIRLKQFAKTRGIPVDQLSDREKYYATHFDFDETPNWFETVAVSSFNGDRTINGVDRANDIGEVKQSDLDASYTESEALNRQMEYLDKADILSNDASTLSKIGSSIKNYAWDHLSTFASNSLLFGAQKYWDEGVGEIIAKQNRGEALSYSEKRALEAEYNKQRLLSYGESLKNNDIANMDGANVYDLTNAGVDMLQFSLPIVGVNWLGRGVTFLGKGIRVTNTAKNASEGISKGAKIWNATRNVTGYTLETAGRTLSMDLYDPAKRLTYKSLVKAGAAQAAPTVTRAAGVAAGSMAHMGSIIGGTAVEANTIGLGMWKEEFNRYAAGYIYAQKNADGDIEYGRISMKDAFGNDIDTEEEYDRMATNQVLGEFGSEKTGLYFDKIMNAVIKKSGFSFLSKNMFANIARNLSKITGGTTTGYIGEGVEEVMNNTWGGFTGLMKWDEVTDPGQNLQMAGHLLVAMLQQGVVVSALGGVKDKASIYRMTNRQINEARNILKEQFLKANANNPEAEKIFNKKYEDAVQLIKQNIRTSQSLFNDNINITDENKDYGFRTKELMELFGLNKDKSEFTPEDKVMMSALSQFVGVYTVGHMSNEALSNSVINNLTTVKGRGWNQLIASTGGRLRKNNRGRTHTLIIPDENGNDIDTGIEFSVDRNGNATPVNTDDAKSGLALNLGSVFINKKDGTYKSFNDETKKKLNSYRDYFITQRNALVKNAFIYQTLAKSGRLNNVLSKVDDYVESNKVSLIRAKIGNFFDPDKYEKFNKYNDSEYINASQSDKEALRHIQSEAQYVKNFASVAAVAIQNDKFGSLFKAMGAETEFEKQALLANIFANERLKDMYSHDMFVARSSIAERIFGDEAISDTVNEIYKSIVDEAKQLLPTASDTEIGRLNELINGLNGNSDEKIKSAIKSIIIDRLLQSRSLANLYGGLGFMKMMRAQLDGKAKDKLKYMGFPVFDKIEFNLDSAIDNLIKRAVKNDKGDVKYADLVAQYANAYVNDAIIRGSMTGDKSLNEVLSELYKSGFITDADIMSSAKTRMKSMFRVSEESVGTFADFINELARDLGYTRDNKNEDGELSLLYNKVLSSSFDSSLGLTRETILKVFNEIDLDNVNDDVAKLIRLVRDNLKEGAEHYNTTVDTVDKFVRNLGDNIDRINKEQADHNKAVLDKMVRQATKFDNTIESDNIVDPADPSADPSGDVETGDDSGIPVIPSAGNTDTDDEEGGDNDGDEDGDEGGDGNQGDIDKDKERNGDGNDNDPGDGGDNSLSDELFAKTNLGSVVIVDEDGIASIDADEMDDFIESLLYNFGINPANIGDPNYTDAVNKANGIYDLVLAHIRSFDYGSETADSIIDIMEKSILSNLNLTIPKIFNGAIVGTNEDELFKTDMTKTHLGTFMYYTKGTKGAFTSYFKKNKSLNKDDVKLTLFRLDNGEQVDVSIDDIKNALNRIKQALNKVSGLTSRSIEDGSATVIFNELLDASTDINIGVSVLQDGKLIKIGDLYGGILRQLASEGEANTVKEYENDPSEVINLAHDREHLLESIVNALEEAMSSNSSITEKEAIKSIGVSDLRMYFPTLDGDKEPSNSEGSPIGVGMIDMNANNVYMPGDASYDSRQTVFKSVDGNTQFTMNSVKIGRQEFAVRLKSEGEGYDTVVFNGSNIGMFNGIDPTDREANRANAIKFVKHLMTLFARADRDWFNASLEYLNRFILVENLHEDLASIRDAYEKMIERGANEDDVTTVMFNGNKTELSLKQARKILDDNSYGASIEVIPNINRDDSTKSGLSKSLEFVVHYIDDEDGSRRTFAARFDENTINKIINDFDNSNIDDRIANMAIDLYTAVTTRMAFNLNKSNFTSDGTINKIDSWRAPYGDEIGAISFIPGIFEFNANDYGGYDTASKLTIAQIMQRSGAFVCGAKLDDGGHVQKSSIPKVYIVSGSCNLKFERQGGTNRNVISLGGINGGSKQTPTSNAPANLPTRPESTNAQTETLNKLNDIDRDYNSTRGKYIDGSKFGITSVSAGIANKTADAANNAGDSMRYIGTIMDSIYRIVIEDIIGDSGVYSKNPTADDVLRILTNNKNNNMLAFIRSLFTGNALKTNSIKYIAEDGGMSRYDMVKAVLGNYIAGEISAGYQNLEDDFAPYIKNVSVVGNLLSVILVDKPDTALCDLIYSRIDKFAQQISDNISNILAGAGVEFGDIIKISDARCVTKADGRKVLYEEKNGRKVESTYDGPKVSLELTKESIGAEGSTRMPDRMLINGEADIIIVKKNGETIVSDFKVIAGNDTDGTLTSNIDEASSSSDGKYFNQLNIERLGLEQKGIKVRDKSMSIIATEVAPITIGTGVVSFKLRSNNDNKPRIIPVPDGNPKVNIDGQVFEISDTKPPVNPGNIVVDTEDNDDDDNEDYFNTNVNNESFGSNNEIHYRAKTSYSLNDNPVDLAIVKTDEYGRSYIDIEDAISYIRSIDSIKYSILKRIVNAAIRNGVSRIDVTDIMKAFGSVRVRKDGSLVDVKLSIDRDALRDKDCFANTVLHELIHAALIGIDTLSASSSASDLYSKYIDYMNQSDSVKAASIKQIITNFDEFLAEGGNDYALGSFVEWAKANNVQLFGGNSRLSKVCNALISLLDKIFEYLGISNFSTKLAKKVVMYEILRFIDTNRDGSAKNNVAEGITIINRSNNNQIIDGNAVIPFAILDGTTVKLGLANVLGIDQYDDGWFARNSEKIRQSAFLSSILSVYRTTNNIESLRSRLIGRDGNGLMKAIDDAINGEEISNKSAARVIKLLDTYLTVCGFYKQSNGTFVNYAGELEEALDDVFKAVNESGDKKPTSVLKAILSNDRLKSVAEEMSSAIHAIAENSAQDGNLETAALRGDFDGMISINNGLSITERFKDEPHFDVHTLDVMQNITSSIGGIYSSYKNFKTRSDIALAMKSICSPALKDMYFGGSLEFSITASRIIQIIDEQAKVVLDRVTSSKDGYSYSDIKILENLADIRNNILSGDEYTKQIVIDAIADIESKITVIRDEHRADTLQDVIQYSEKDIDPMLSMSPRLKLLLSLIPRVSDNPLSDMLIYNGDTGMPEMWDTERIYRILSNISSNERTSGAPGFSTFSDFVYNLGGTLSRTNVDPETRSVVIGMLFMIRNSTFFDNLDKKLKDELEMRMYGYRDAYKAYEAKNSAYKMREQDLALMLSFMNRDILESENISVAKGGVVSRSSGSGNFTKNTVKIANDNALQMLMVEVSKVNPSINEYDPSDAQCMLEIRKVLDNIEPLLGTNLSIDALYDSLVKLGFVSVNKSDITQATSSNFKTILEKSISLIRYALNKDEDLAKTTTDDIDQTDQYMSAPYRMDLYDANGKFKKPRKSTDKIRFYQNDNVGKMQSALSSIGKGRAMMSTASTRNAKGERIQLDKASNFIESHFRKVKRDVVLGTNGKTKTVTDEYKRNFDCEVSLSTNGGLANSIYEYIENLEISHDGPMEDSRAGSTTKKNDYADRNAIDLICSKFKNILNGCVVLPTMSSNGYCEKIRDTRGFYGRRTFLYSLLNDNGTGVSIGSRGYRELAKRALIEVASARRESEIAASIIKGKEVGSDSYKGYHYVDNDEKGRLIGSCATLPRFGSIYFTMDHDLGRKNSKGDTVYDKRIHKLDLNKIINSIINSSLNIDSQTEMLNKVYDLAYAVYSSSVLTANSNDDTIVSVDNAVKSITEDSRFNGIVDSVDTQITQLNDFVSKSPRGDKDNTGLSVNINIFRTLLRLLADEDLNTLVRNGAVVIDESGQVQLNAKLPDLDSEVPVDINGEVLNISVQDMMNDPSTAGTGGLLGLKKYLDIVELFGLIGLVDFENFFASQPNMFKNKVDQTKRYQSYMSTGTEPCIIKFDDDINIVDNEDDSDFDSTRMMHKALSSTEFKYASMKDVAVGETDNGVFNTVVDVDHIDEKGKYLRITMRDAFRQYAENLYSGVSNEKHRRKLIESFIKIRMDKLSGDSIASSDGACFITMAGLRKYLIKEGRWSADRIDEFFKAVNDGTAMSRPELREMYINIVLSPMKLIYTGMTQGARVEVTPSNPDEEGNTVRRDKGATKVRVMKMAVFPLLPSMLKEGTVGARLAKIAEDSGAELIGDNEIEKVGGLDSQTLFKQSNTEIDGDNGATIKDNGVTKIPTISINAQFLRRQMETNPHEDDIRKLGTQMMFQTISDLCDTDEDGNPVDTKIRVLDGSSTDGKYVERSGREMVDGIFKKMNNLEKAECRKILDSWVTTVNGVEAISVSKLKAILESTAIEHALGSDVIREIRRLGGEEYVPLSMLVRSPLFQAKIMAIVRNSAQSLSSNGGSFIQVPQTIFRAIGDNSTRLELVNEHGSMDCIISINAFKSILDTVDWSKYRSDNGIDPNEYGSKYNDPRFYTFDEAKKFLTENNIIGRNAKPISVGYRIPTQSKASISSLRVMDVVGAECGDMIVMPDGYVNITGSDFDIDKLYVATKSFTVISDADGRQVVVPIKTYLDKLIKSKETASPDKVNKIQTEINKIEALSIASDIIDDYISIITSPDQFVDTHTTIDSGTKLFKDPDTGLIKRLNTTFTGGKFRVSLISVVDKETGETKEETAESSVYENSISYQINKKLENAGAKFGIGPFAKASVNHVLAQIAGLKLSDKAAALLGVKSLARIKSRDGIKISDWISYFINAHVDAAKDPYILDFNINKTTWSAACLMLRAGFGEQTLYVLSQESIRTFAMANELASACAVSDDRVRQSKSVRRDNLINEYISRKIEGILNTFYSINKKTGSYSVNDNINIPEDMRLILDHMFTTYNEDGEAINGLFTKKGKYWTIDNKFVKNNQEVASKIFNIFLGNGEPSYIEKNGKVYFANNSTRLLQAMSDISTSGKSSIEYESDSNGNKSKMTRDFNDVYQLALLVTFQSINSIGKSLDTVVNTCQVEQGGTGTNYYEFKRYLDGISDAVNESSDDIENVTDMYRKTHLLDKILDISGVTTKIMAGTSVAATPNALALYENVLAVTGNKFNYGRRVSNGIFSAIENESLIRAFDIDKNRVMAALGAKPNVGSKFDLRLEFNKLKSTQSSTLSQNYGLTDDEINALSNLYVGGVIVNGVNVPVMSKSSIDMQVSDIELIKSALDKLYRNKKTKALVENIVLNSLYTEGLIQSGSGVFNILCPWCAYILKDLTLRNGVKANLKTVSEKQMDVAQYDRGGDRMFGVKAGVYRFILKYGFINDLIYRHTHDGKDWSVPFEMNKPFVINGKIRYESLPTMFTSTDSELRSKMFVKMSNKGRTKLYMKMLVYNRGSEIPTPTKEKADISSIEDGIPERRITFKDRKDSKSKSETYVFVEVPADYSRNGASVVQNTSIVSQKQRDVELRDLFENVIKSNGDDLIKAVMDYITYLSNEFKSNASSVVGDKTVAADDPELKYLNTILGWSNENKKLMPLATKIKNADKTNVNSFFSIEYDGDSMSIPYGGNSNIDTSTGYDELISKFADIYIRNLMPNGVVYKGKKETIQDMYITLSSILNTIARGNIEVSDSSPFVNGSVTKALNDVSDFVSSVYADVDVDIDMCDNIYTTIKTIEKKCSEIVDEYMKENCL